MAWECQRSPYLRQFESKVVSCTPAKLEGKNGFDVVLEDTILFPAGGGQPDDRGTINEVPVHDVRRDGSKAVHFTEKSLEVDANAHIVVDWNRRFDHMQQHTGQHLITAVFENRYGYKTLSWNLGKVKSSIELSCKSMTQEEIDCAELEINKAIKANTPVSVHLYEKDDPGLEKIRSRGIPDDFAGPVRVVEIENIDANTCCGTHLANLSHLQMIKLLHTEPTRGCTRIHFLAGNRVMNTLCSMINTERKLTQILSCGPEDHVDQVQKLQKTAKSSQKAARNYLREIATLEAEKFNNTSDLVLCVHREDGDMDFLNVINSKIRNKNAIIFLSVGSNSTGGQFLLTGPPSLIDKIGPSVAERLQGKGGGKKGRYQGKAKAFNKITDVQEFVKNSAVADSS
ncbi:uncharacterized protein TRIADDRAFT_20746 [Trichoplax adhaerens]|uniref:Threonyl/alanyl tRNA synthetase SAD domain-containing protein n=1 Tax=Trichoplax adhaerens TaxID=10228 RepID=B3RQ03_TRIAD|nr:hypothetical protein TRIADDRAFT_20746 [Trichoplax adhaerens]EDV27732.1 hypothetical protein TRIADDRAFT_20746 [Trichoplax adhaerens]|eukprot:XP_002109566.1 hypothetical protein TRIADDRAFT_20746 [Trichoplax adhaerens]